MPLPERIYHVPAGRRYVRVVDPQAPQCLVWLPESPQLDFRHKTTIIPMLRLMWFNGDSWVVEEYGWDQETRTLIIASGTPQVEPTQ